MIIETESLNSREVYKLLHGSVVPRPIAWVSTVYKNGIRNLAPFSFFTAVSTDPPTVCFSVGPGTFEGREIKDTLANIIETNEFVINVVSVPLANQMFESSASFSPEVDEFEAVGVTPAKCKFVGAPRVQESLINMECKLDRIIEVGINRLVLGRIVCYHINEEIYLGNYKVDIQKLQPIGRLAGNYALVNDFFELPNKNFLNQ